MRRRATGGRTLWTPGRDIPLDDKTKIAIDRPVMIALSYMQEFAQKYGITLVCKSCNQGIQGENNDSSVAAGKPLSISCNCREWFFDPTIKR